MKRPLRHRIWFWKPQWHWFGWRTLNPFIRGSDEWDWHTIGFGWTITGRVFLATRRCPQTGRCDDGVVLALDWPADPCAEHAECVSQVVRGVTPTESTEYEERA